MKRKALFLALAALAVLLFTQQASAAITDCDQWVGGPWTVVYGTGNTATPAGTYEMISYARQLPTGTNTNFTALSTTWDCSISFKRRKQTGNTPADYVAVIMGRKSGTAGPYYFYEACTTDDLLGCASKKYSSATIASMPSNSVTFTAATAKMATGVKTPLPAGDYNDLAGSIWKFTFDAAYDRTPGDNWGNITGDYNVVFGPLSSVIFNYNPAGSPVTMDWYVDGLRSDGRKVAMYAYNLNGNTLPYYQEWDSAGTTLNGPYGSKPYKGLFKESYFAWGFYSATLGASSDITYGVISATKLTCIDADGDTYGVNCAAGPDCDDTNSAVHPGATEICNGIDDNCDGSTDEGFNVGGACSAGIGECLRTGHFVCSAGAAVCDAVPGAPVAETCNGLDDDCDGVVDNGNPGGGGACSTGLLGICAAGTTACTAGAVVCNQNQQPGPEICDGLDNDCDGTVDNGNPGGGGACSTGLLGICSAGTTACTNGSIGCHQNQQPGPETCNGLDDDCDGVVDNGNPGGGAACSTGKLGICSAGTTACTAGVPVCNQNQQPGTETCNGLDDNCNGTTDEGCIVWYQDSDCDGYGYAAVTTISINNPGNGPVKMLSSMHVTCWTSTNSTDCNDSNSAIHPGATEICNGLDDNCDGQTDEGNPGGGVACSTGKLGICAAGTTACTAGSIACNQNQQPGPETCNGLDDDCNGEIDDGFPTETYYQDADKDTYGNAAVTSLGPYCAAPHGYVADNTDCDDTDNQTYPFAPELCDGIDNDCDGVIDNGWEAQFHHYYRDVDGDTYGTADNVTLACAPPPGYVDNRTGLDCDDTNSAVHHGATEICNGIDDNCDGSTDEGFNVGGSCSAGTGECLRTGHFVCSAGVAVCDAVPGTPVAETCNGLDDDCDGVVDNGNPGGGAACSTGKPGICSAGTTACTNGSIVCNQNQQPGPETCNGLDDDCDGVVDNGNPGGGAACSTGKPGICSAGTTACTAGAPVCNQNQQPGPEICDGLDNDCDGVVDNGNPGGGAACSTGKHGVCSAGTTACTNGAPVCNQNQQPVAEICDGLDNDCDGVVDNGNPGGGAACSTGKPGICSAGTTACTNGAPVCNQNQQPGPEICNGLDDDCDGVVDNGNPGGGAACSTGKPGICSAGTTACTAGATVCNQNQQPVAEICNGLDDNCDGQTDEGNPGGGGACITGLPGVCSAGTKVCAYGVVGCSPNQQSGPEICDGLDNDCDGVVDNGIVPIPTTCGVGACARTGVTTCSGGVPGDTCTPGTGSPEVCDGIDNNCDGQTDEGFPLNRYTLDFDNDTYGDNDTSVYACAEPDGYIPDNGSVYDCNDMNSAVHPGAAELCNGIDDNCNGQTDEGCATPTTSTTTSVSACIDNDNDTYGENCAAGPDCDDNDKTKHAPEDCNPVPTPCALNVIPDTICKWLVISFYFINATDNTVTLTPPIIVTFESGSAISDIVHLPIGPRAIFGFLFVNPFAAISGDYTVELTYGSNACEGTFKVK